MGSASRKVIGSGALVAALLMTACGVTENYVYRPAERATARMAGQPAAYYAVPPSSPTGDVRVATFGVTEIELEQEGFDVPVLHVRMIIANNNDSVPWVVDTREQYASIAGAGASANPKSAEFVRTEGASPPMVQVPRGEARTIDLYYLLPRGRRNESAIPEFDLVWQAETGNGRIVERTPFERVSVEPPASPGSCGYGVSPMWWYDPFWPGVGLAPTGWSARAGSGCRPR